MLNDAQSLWNSVVSSSVVQTLTSALRSEDNYEEGNDDENDEDSENKEEEVEEEEEEDSSPPSSSDLVKLKSEKKLLSNDVKSLEKQIKKLMRAKNELSLSTELNDDSNRQLALLKAEFKILLEENQRKDRNKSDTIESLVEEYSKLASEYEIKTRQSDLQLLELSKENEVLAIKTHVLEQTLTELANQSHASPNSSSTSTSSSSLQVQLKEATFKIVNLQYDLKEKTDALMALQRKEEEKEERKEEGAKETTKSDSFEKETLLLKDQIQHLLAESERVKQEKKEAEEAGKGLAEVIRKLQAEKEEKEKELVEEKKKRELLLENQTSSDFRQTLQAEVAKCKAEIEERVQEIVALKKKMKEEEDRFETEKKVLTESYENILSKIKEEEEIRGMASLEKEEEMERELVKLKDELNKVMKDKEEKASLLLKETEERKKEVTEFDRKLEAFLSEKKKEKEEELRHLSTRLSEEHSLAVQRLELTFEEEKRSALKVLEDALKREKDEEGRRKEEEVRIALLKAEEDGKRALDEMLSSHKEELSAMFTVHQNLSAEMERVKSEMSLRIKEEVERAEKVFDLKRVSDLEHLRTAMEDQIKEALSEKEEYFSLYLKEREARKDIHNKLIELQGNIRVLCRVRPVLEVEKRQGGGNEVDVTEFINDDVIGITRDPQTKTRFEFDRVFDQSSTQELVFASVQPLCISVLDGYNVCIFAYGQTGSGKTFTMEGEDTPKGKGVAPRAVEELFNQISLQKETGNIDFVVKFSMLEIYNESIRDLLDGKGEKKRESIAGKEKEKLEVRQTADGNNVVTGLTEEEVDTFSRVLELMAVGQTSRAVGSHDMNEHSSRSHSILTLTVTSVNRIDASTTFGKLHLIDLAGSERLSKTEATGDRLKEAQNINRSLSALGDVISALGNKKSTHIPYRNSKLTFLLQDSLGGRAKVLMFVNISPAVYNVSETLCSLNFAARCRSVELGQAKKQQQVSGSSGANGGTDNGVAGGGGISAPVSSASGSSATSSGGRAGRVSLGLPPPVPFKKL